MNLVYLRQLTHRREIITLNAVIFIICLASASIKLLYVEQTGTKNSSLSMLLIGYKEKYIEDTVNTNLFVYNLIKT